MDTELAVSIITLLGSAFGTLMGVFVNIKLTNFRLKKLEEKVDKHNNLIERTYKIESDIAVIDERISEVTEHIKNKNNFA